MGNNCNLILGSFYTKNLVDELQLSMCVFINKHKQKSIGLFLTSDLKVDNELLVSYVQKMQVKVQSLSSMRIWY